MIRLLIIYYLVTTTIVLGLQDRPNRGQRFNLTSSTTTRKPTNDRTRIIGGIETERNEYPFIVTLSRNTLHFCGGSIIDASWIVTAAHCAVRPDFNVTAGEHDLRITEGSEQEVKAVKVIRHPDYNPVTYEDDIALVKVEPPFVFTKYVQTFNVPSAHFIATGNVTTAGWGVEEEGSHEVSPVLRKVTIGLFPNMECAKQYGNGFHSHKMICAGQEEGGKDACQGDSGGPLLCSDHRDGATLCGIVSFGFGCARKNFVGVYTKVSYFSDWIMWEQSKDLNPDKTSVWLTRKPPVTTDKAITSNVQSTTPTPNPLYQWRNSSRPSRRPGGGQRSKNDASIIGKNSIPIAVGFIFSLLMMTQQY